MYKNEKKEIKIRRVKKWGMTDSLDSFSSSLPLYLTISPRTILCLLRNHRRQTFPFSTLSELFCRAEYRICNDHDMYSLLDDFISQHSFNLNLIIPHNTLSRIY
jgi:hypothetical protein